MTNGLGVATVVAAAGLSRRMGKPKQLLPWGHSTVIETVVSNLTKAGATPVIVVTGHCAAEVRASLQDTGAIIVPNPDYERSEMLRSYQIGLGQLRQVPCRGALFALGDQPHIPAATLRAIVDKSVQYADSIIIPSYDMRRGHPLYLPASLWDELLALEKIDTLRSVLDAHRAVIHYVNVETPAVLYDIDTPSDYETLKPS